MGLLDGDIRSIIGEALQSIMLDGTYYVTDGAGTETANHPVRGFVDDYTDHERGMLALPAEDRRITMLADGLAFTPNLNGRVTMEGTKYAVLDVVRDPAGDTWTMRGRPV